MIVSELYDFVHEGELEKVSEWLSRRPEDINIGLGDGYAPLHVACMFGQLQTVQWLVARGALVNMNAANASKATPLHLAVVFRDEKIADQITRELINNGAELNAVQAGGETALHNAVSRASSLIVATLVEAGADPFLKDERGRSSSDLAKAMEADDEAVKEGIDEQEELKEIRETLRSAVRN